jgi:hypothetical protein
MEADRTTSGSLSAHIARRIYAERILPFSQVTLKASTS